MCDHLPSTVGSAFLFEMTNEKCQMIYGKSLLGAGPKRKRLSRIAASLAFMLSETDLIPESIAYDPVDKAFFLVVNAESVR